MTQLWIEPATKACALMRDETCNPLVYRKPAQGCNNCFKKKDYNFESGLFLALQGLKIQKNMTIWYKTLMSLRICSR